MKGWSLLPSCQARTGTFLSFVPVTGSNETIWNPNESEMVEQYLEDERLEPTNHPFRKENGSSKPPWLCSMLIFRGVDGSEI